jgi:hypothetical protein
MLTSQDSSSIGTMQAISTLIDRADRVRYAEILDFLSRPARLLFDPLEAKRYRDEAVAARQDLLVILRRAATDDARVAELIRHFEGRAERD